NVPTPIAQAVPSAPAVTRNVPTPIAQAVPSAPAITRNVPTPVAQQIPPAPAVNQNVPTPIAQAVPSAPAVTRNVPTPVAQQIPPAPAVKNVLIATKDTDAYAKQVAAMLQANINANNLALAHAAANSTAIQAQGAQINQLQDSTNQRFNDLNKMVKEDRKHASQGIANVAAMANIPQVTGDQDFTIGAGVGAFDSETGVAVGVSARVSQNVTVKASVGAGSTGGATLGAGISYGY
ncbi:TPA: YadA-like family protein, partial [Salmonella enterica]|nr:YadA-like family protein [Salmonella enterica]